MNATDQSRQTKIDATDILDQTCLINRLSKYGDARIGGSYFTDLMFDADIDITVATENPLESAIEFLNEAIKDRMCEKYQYGDFEKFGREKRPKDHIVALVLTFNGRRWEIEIWFTKEHYVEQLAIEDKLKCLPAETKHMIIDLKHKRAKSGISKHQLSSFDMYRDFL
jgi:hypothetical protein